MLGAIKAFLVSIATLLGIIKHRQVESAGRAKAERDQLRENEDARKRMEAVKPAGESGTVDKLRDGEF